MALTLNNHVATGAKVKMPLAGVWHADGFLDEEVEISGAAVLDADGDRFVGTVLRGKPFGGRTPFRIVGGGGSLSRLVAAQNYASGPTIRTLVRDILGAKESLSSTSDDDVLGSVLPNYHRIEELASHALTRVLDGVGATWRVLADGTVWVGRNTFPTATVEHVVEDEDWSAGIIYIAPESTALRPGVTFNGHEIREVVHCIDETSLRTEACVTSGAGVLEKFLGIIRRDIDYTKRYPARVAKVNSDGTIQVVPDSLKVRGKGLDRVRVRSGMPGLITPKKNARCILTFDESDPAKPSASDWENGDVEEMIMADGIAPASRVGSTVNVFFPPATPVSGTLNGLPFVGVATFVLPGLGIIQDGNNKVKV